MKLLLSLILLMFSAKCLADGEKISIQESDAGGQAYWVYYPNTPTQQNPCVGRTFQIEKILPTGYDIILQYQWYINSVLVKTETDPSKYINVLAMLSEINDVSCSVTYKNTSTGATITKSSNIFKIYTNQLGITISQIGNAVNGCTNAVAFTASRFSGPSVIYTPPVGTYTIQWTAPAGWVQSSISSSGDNVTFIPTAVGDGTVTGTVRLNGCAFTKPITSFVTRTTPLPPSFPSSSYFVCKGTNSQTFSINGVCGASNYTYTISGNSGCYFTSNNLQTITSSSTSVSVSFSQPQTNFSVALSAVGNIPSVGSSPAGTTNITYGVPPAPTNLSFGGVSCPEYTFSCDYIPSYAYNWSHYNLTTNVQTNLSVKASSIKIVFPTNANFKVGVSRTNSCGTSPISFMNISVTCSSGGGGHRIISNNNIDSLKVGVSKISNIQASVLFPNPANDYFTVDISTIQNNTQKNNSTGIRSIMIYNGFGQIVISNKYNGLQKVVNVSSKKLISGIYNVKILVGNVETITRLVIKRK